MPGVLTRGLCETQKVEVRTEGLLAQNYEVNHLLLPNSAGA